MPNEPMPQEPAALDVVPPARIAQLVEEVGVKKARLPLVQTLTLGILAGAFIAFGALAEKAVAIAQAKVALGPLQAFVRGVLCNMLVCLAIWICFAAHTVAGKVLAIVFPVTAFVALGFEHSVANMYLIPIGALQVAGAIGIADILGNLIPVTLGNIVGGGALVALVYWLIYLRQCPKLELNQCGIPGFV